jgi:hypothetical protein
MGTLGIHQYWPSIQQFMMLLNACLLRFFHPLWLILLCRINGGFSCHYQWFHSVHFNINRSGCEVAYRRATRGDKAGITLGEESALSEWVLWFGWKITP